MRRSTKVRNHTIRRPFGQSAWRPAANSPGRKDSGSIFPREKSRRAALPGQAAQNRRHAGGLGRISDLSLGDKTGGDCPNFAQPAKQNGTVPFAPDRFVPRLVDRRRDPVAGATRGVRFSVRRAGPVSHANDRSAADAHSGLPVTRLTSSAAVIPLAVLWMCFAPATRAAGRIRRRRIVRSSPPSSAIGAWRKNCAAYRLPSE